MSSAKAMQKVSTEGCYRIEGEHLRMHNMFMMGVMGLIITILVIVVVILVRKQLAAGARIDITNPATTIVNEIAAPVALHVTNPGLVSGSAVTINNNAAAPAVDPAPAAADVAPAVDETPAADPAPVELDPAL
jgi:hypothetical protein